MNRPRPLSEIQAVYVICVYLPCRCHSDGLAHGPFWRQVWQSGGGTRSRYVHRADARRVAILCGRRRLALSLHDV